MRTVLTAAGLVMTGVGVFCLANRGQSFTALAFAVGLALLIVGAVEIAVYAVTRGRRETPAWILTEGIAACLTAAAILSDRPVAEADLFALFGLRLIFAGAARIAGGADLKETPRAMRAVLFVVGVSESVIGLYGFFHPLGVNMAAAVLLGVFFAAEGIGVCAAGFAVFGHAAEKRRGRKRAKSATRETSGEAPDESAADEPLLPPDESHFRATDD